MMKFKSASPKTEMIYTTIMSQSIPEKLNVSLFQVPEDCRAKLAEIAALPDADGKKTSINACIIEALEDYLNLPLGEQSKPILPKVPLRAFTVRTTTELKQRVSHCAATWQLKCSFPISMNAVVNTAILVFLQKKIPGYRPPF